MTGRFVDARALLREAGLRPKRSFGQNFLVDDHVLDAIARACVPDPELERARVLELGAGLGALTAKLAARAARVDAVERDRELVPSLEALFAEERAAGRVVVHEADAQQVDVAALLGASAPRVLCGNLPYQITGALLERAVHAAAALDRAVFMVQLEVADRIVADPGSKTYGALSVFVQAAFRARRVLRVGPGSFHPPPDVASAVIELVPSRRAEETPTFRALVRAAFGARRKTLRNAWGKAAPDAATLLAAATEAGVDLERRGETLAVEDFARVAAALDARRA